MTNNLDYRLYLEKCFDQVNEKLDAIVEQTTKINSRVTKLEDKSHERQIVINDFYHVKDDYSQIKQDVKNIKNDLEEYRLFKKHPKWGIFIITIFVLTMALSIIQTVKLLL